jgi:hypothetical protein
MNVRILLFMIESCYFLGGVPEMSPLNSLVEQHLTGYDLPDTLSTLKAA